MDPILVAVSGPLNGATFKLESDETSIGRDATNGICLPGGWVSRKHCAIRKKASDIVIRDLESRNGTFVNGIPVSEHTLVHGDLIAVGDSCFRFLVSDRGAVDNAGVVEIQDTVTVNWLPTWLRQADARYLDFDRVPQGPSAGRVLRDLSTLLKVATRIGSIQDPESIYSQVLGIVFDIVPAARAAILLLDRSTEEMRPVFGWDRASGPNKPVQVSRGIVSQVLAEKAATLVNDIPQALTHRTLDDMPAQSVLCVPLMSAQNVIGVIYLDSHDPAVRFDEEHLQLMMGVAGISALALERIEYLERLRNENRRLQADLQLNCNMVGESSAMRKIMTRIAKVTDTDSTVLLMGESGTGKELVARAIHHNSSRKDAPFVAINCAAIPDTLLESELFGHEKGAFTGAALQKKGQVELAHTGSLFLDEISDLAPALQAKLLRVLQERELVRVGGGRPIKVDIRVIAATNRDLADAVAQGNFRQDLFYRLNVVSMKIPPLRERKEDIALLANYFLAKFSHKCKRHVLGISPEARSCLLEYAWPGNVRELENAIEHAVVLGSTEMIIPEDLPEEVLEAQPVPGVAAGYQSAVIETKKQLILQAVEQAKGNYTEAARLLGVHPNYLHRLIRNMNLREELKTLKASKRA